MVLTIAFSRARYHGPGRPTGCQTRGEIMINAIVLLRVKTDRINEVAQELVDLEGISEVYSVAGQYDLVVVVRGRTNDQIASLVTDHVLKSEGLISSETLIAFRTFSHHDLERLFSIGMD
jgi:DNA-binding Lrp family transcriptional regulator